ncbi:hypothetical protein CHS0354_019646, partial [Potamilus streckersoni]
SLQRSSSNGLDARSAGDCRRRVAINDFNLDADTGCIFSFEKFANVALILFVESTFVNDAVLALIANLACVPFADAVVVVSAMSFQAFALSSLLFSWPLILPSLLKMCVEK